MKVIFLDFNGVLDTWDNYDVINPDNLQRLKRIINETGAKVVLSSSLKKSCNTDGRFTRQCQKVLKDFSNAGINIIDITPLAPTREAEIQLYLDMHPEVENYCIIDDDYDMKSFKNHMVKLPMQMNEGATGLDDEHMYIAINILNKENHPTKTILKTKNF